MIRDLAELYRHRELLWIWILREIRVRYKQSILGAGWAIIQPLVLMIVFSVIFSFLVPISTSGIPYPVFSYAAVLPWTFLASTITFGIPSLINNFNLVTKSYFPREILPIGALGVGFLDYLIASTIFAVLLAGYRMPVNTTILWVPLILLLQILLMLGVTLLGSALVIRYRDIRFLVPLGLQLWFFATPVIYPLSVVPERLLPFYLLNPMAGLIEAYRAVFLASEPPSPGLLSFAAVFSVVTFIIGYGVFKRLEVSFADII